MVLFGVTACTGTGLAEFVTDKSAEFPTCTLADALLLALFGSLVVDATDTVSVIVVPEATVVFAVTTKVKLAAALAVRVPIVQVKGAVEVHVHPGGPLSDANDVFAGSVSVSVIVVADAGPPLVTVWAKVILLPAVTGFGLPESVTLKSACVPPATAIETVAELSLGFVS